MCEKGNMCTGYKVTSDFQSEYDKEETSWEK